MASQKLVRCELKRPEAGTGTVRYVPLEIFGLWEFLMRTKHGFDVAGSIASLWIDVDENPTPQAVWRALELPCIVIFRRGAEFGRCLGNVDRDTMERLLERAMNADAKD